ncbi:MAG: ATP-binding cassette domain-containing protein [Verrucomicrobiae bacterium]
MSGKANSLVEMRGVRLSFAEKAILESVDFSLPAREVLVIMGLSGSGKSTLLDLLLGLLKPDAGSILFGGEELTGLSRPKLNAVRKRLGMVFQNSALISSMDVGGNVALPLTELSGKSRDEIRAIVDQKLELVGLQDARGKLPSELSGGMQKRVGLARALSLDPELVLFDEPSAGLDPVNSKIIDELIIQLRDEHKVTSIVVTHEMESAFAVATRMAFLHEGKMILEGTPDEFKNSTNPDVSAFLSSYSAHLPTKE